MLPNNDYRDLRSRREMHGMTHTPEYGVWQRLRDRCYNKNNPRYERYGGRGITVCDEWRLSFEAFYMDMGQRPDPSLSIERVNNNLGYFKNNCKWGTDEEQAINKGIHSRNTSGVKGVGYSYRDNLWIAYVNRNKQRIYLYNGKDFFEACAARKSWDTKNG
jgi:hypothetical protein